MRRRWYVTWALVGIAAILAALALVVSAPASPDRSLNDQIASVSSVLEAPSVDSLDDVVLVAMAAPAPVPARTFTFSPVVEATSAPVLPPPVPPPER